MGRELQKKRNRSSIPRLTKRRNARIHKIKKFGSQLIAQNWDKKETLRQNYQRLGLAVKLNKPTGGVEKLLSTNHDNSRPSAVGSFPPVASVAPASSSIVPGFAQIERDADGNVVKVHYGKTWEQRLDELEEGEGEGEGEGKATPMAATEETTPVVKKLMEHASMGAKVERYQSVREKEWVERLVEKHGDDYRRMAWDKKLNPFQQTEADIKKRVLKWKENKAHKIAKATS